MFGFRPVLLIDFGLDNYAAEEKFIRFEVLPAP
jgi:hypothetical protein